MSVLLRIALILFLPASAVWAQDAQQMMEKMFQHMEQMQQRMMRDFFDDDFFGSRDKDSFFGKDFFSGFGAEYYQHYWKDAAGGKMLVIIPTKKDSPLDIKVNSQSVTIKSKVKIEQENSEQNFRSSRMESFENTIALPPQLNGDKSQVKQMGKEIQIFFPYREGMSMPASPTAPQRPSPEPEEDVVPVFPQGTAKDYI